MNNLKLSHTIFDVAKKVSPSVLILLHGLFGSKKNFESIAKYISQNSQLQVITVDARNHGDSFHNNDHNYLEMAKDVENLMSYLNISSANILGHSMGGKTAMTLALNNPGLVNSLIIEDIAPTMSTAAEQTVAKDSLNFRDVIKSLKSITFEEKYSSITDARKYANDKLKNIVTEKTVRDFLVTNIKETLPNTFSWRLNIDALDNHLNDVFDFPTFDNASYRGPTMFIAGQKSTHITLSDQPIIFQLFPKSYTVYLEGAGHWLHSEKPNEFLQIVMEFFKNNKILDS